MACKRPPAPPAWMDTKTSATIIDFGMPLIEQLPADAPMEIRQGIVSFIVQVWNRRDWARPDSVGSVLSCPIRFSRPGRGGAPRTRPC